MRKLFCVIAAVALGGCDLAKPSYQVATDAPVGKETSAPQTTYEFNGTVAGCKLYYVRPAFGGPFQFAACPNATTAWTETCGRGCTREVSVQTAAPSTAR